MGMGSEEEYLIKQLKKGNSSAFEYVVGKYGDRLYRVCFMILKDMHLAEDVVQEVFIQVYKNINDFKGNSALYTWIYKIAINRCRNVLKKNYRDIPTEEIFEDEIKLDNEFENKINSMTIKELIAALKPQYREVITLFYLEDISIREICEILGENENTIKSRLSRGRKILKDCLVKEGFKDEQGQIG